MTRFLWAALLLLSGCAIVAIEVPRDNSAPPGPEATCRTACAKSRACDEQTCARGCNLVMDRLVEHEGPGVLACVAARAKAGCGDGLWAQCAAQVGPHADGGPPAPPPSEDYEE